MRTRIHAMAVLAPVLFGLAACSESGTGSADDPSQDPRTPAEPEFDGTITLADGTVQPISDLKPLAADYDHAEESWDRYAESLGLPRSGTEFRRVFQECLTEEDVAQGFEALVMKGRDKEACRFESFTIEDGKLNAPMVCVADGAELRVENVGEVSQFGGEWTTTIKGRAFGMKVDTEIKTEWRRIKAC